MSTEPVNDLPERTKRFAINVLRLIDRMPDSVVAKTISYQVSKSAPSQAANYREARRARSNKEFISKLNISIQETEETRFWLECIAELFPQIGEAADPLLNESSELIAIYTASVKTASGHENETPDRAPV